MSMTAAECVHEVIADRFEIEQIVSRTEMSVVYRAHDRHTGEPVAVKMPLGDGSRYAERFHEEASLLAELAHPRIVRHVDHGLTRDGRHYLAMEWLDGEDLAHRLRRGPLEVVETIALARHVSEALRVLHQRAHVHRDLKPSNLFLPDGKLERVTLLDFGIARPEQRVLWATTTGKIVGTFG
jgi:serine/threonine protein kinase